MTSDHENPPINQGESKKGPVGDFQFVRGEERGKMDAELEALSYEALKSEIDRLDKLISEEEEKRGGWKNDREGSLTNKEFGYLIGRRGSAVNIALVKEIEAKKQDKES